MVSDAGAADVVHRCWHCGKRLPLDVELGPALEAFMKSPGAGEVDIYCKDCRKPNTLRAILERASLRRRNPDASYRPGP